MIRLALSSLVWVVIATTYSSLALAAEYARPELLVEVDQLRAYFDGDRTQFRSGQVTLLDVRSLEKHAQGNILPGWRIDIAEWKAAFGDGTDVDGWTQRIASVLLSADSTVIVYDDAVTPNAARAWWILKYWGVKDVRILNGGFGAWEAGGGKVYPYTARGSNAPARFEARPQPDRLRTTEQMQKLQFSGEELVWDVRSTREVLATGTLSPTTQHCDWAELVDADTGKMKSPAELSLLLKLGLYDEILRPPPMVTYCRSGGRASVTAFALELMGVEKVANYFGSWNAWDKRDAAEQRSSQ